MARTERFGRIQKVLSINKAAAFNPATCNRAQTQTPEQGHRPVPASESELQKGGLESSII